MVKQISDNEIYLLIKYIKSVLWKVAKCLSHIQDAQFLKVFLIQACLVIMFGMPVTFDLNSGPAVLESKIFWNCCMGLNKQSTNMTW